MSGAQHTAAVQHFQRGEYHKAAEYFGTGGTNATFAQAYNHELCLYANTNDMDAFQSATKALITNEENGQRNISHTGPTPPTGATGKSSNDNSWFTLNFTGHDAVLYNEAVLFYKRMMYDQAIDRLKSLFRIRGNLQPTMSVKVAVLLYACYVSLFRLDGIVVKELESYLTERSEFLIKMDREEGTHLSRTYEAILPLAEFLRGNSHNAFTDLRSWYEKYRSEGREVDVLYYNNLAVMHHSMNAPGMGMLYLTKAEDVCKDQTLSTTQAIGTTYFNHGLSLVKSSSGHLYSALRCFEVAASVYPHVPIIWVYVAQCCLRTYDLITGSKKRTLNGTSIAQTNGSQTCGTPTHLDYIASHMTRIVDLCVNTADESSEQKDLLQRSGIALRKAFSLSSGDLKSTLSLRCSIASGLAYVALCERNYSLAYAHCVDFFKLWEESGKNNKAAALAVTSYQVEALCMMAQPKEALRTLTNTPLSDLIDPPTTQDASSSKTDITARNTEALFVNLIMAAVLNGHYQRAQEMLLNLCVKNSGKRCFTLLQVYIELAMGNREKAVDIVRKHISAPPFR